MANADKNANASAAVIVAISPPPLPCPFHSTMDQRRRFFGGVHSGHSLGHSSAHVAAAFDHEPFFIRVGNDMLQGLDLPRNLAVGDTLVIVGYYWRAAFERVAQIGHPTLPGWLHQGQIVRQAEAQSVQSVVLVPSFIMPGVVRAINNGRHQGFFYFFRIVCSINVLVNGRVHTLAKRNMHENVIEHLEVGQNVQLHVMEVPAGWWCARNYILPPNALLGTGMEWQSNGGEVFPLWLEI